MKLAPNLIINDRYKLLRQIAVGGMGEMWLANDTTLGREVAVKALREENAGNEDFLQRLRVEARNNAVLNHPNIVALHDYYEQQSIGFIIMEYVEGKSLAQILHENPKLPLIRLLPILIQIARALHFAHTNGIVHRDVKPANILVTPDGLVKVVDFGVSKAMDQRTLTAAGMVVGTAQYLSPEQAMGDGATSSSDIYALGCIAFEASVGHRPFEGKNAVEIAISQVNDPIPPLPETLDAEFRNLVTKLLAKSVSDRPVDAADVARRFEAIETRLLSNENDAFKFENNSSTRKPVKPPSSSKPSLSSKPSQSSRSSQPATVRPDLAKDRARASRDVYRPKTEVKSNGASSHRTDKKQPMRAATLQTGASSAASSTASNTAPRKGATHKGPIPTRGKTKSGTRKVSSHRGNQGANDEKRPTKRHQKQGLVDTNVGILIGIIVIIIILLVVVSLNVNGVWRF